MVPECKDQAVDVHSCQRDVTVHHLILHLVSGVLSSQVLRLTLMDDLQGLKVTHTFCILGIGVRGQGEENEENNVFSYSILEISCSHISNEGVGGNVTGKSNIVCDIVDTACKV